MSRESAPRSLVNNAELVDDDVLDLLYDFFVCHNSQILVYSFITVFRIYAAK